MTLTDLYHYHYHRHHATSIWRAALTITLRRTAASSVTSLFPDQVTR